MSWTINYCTFGSFYHLNLPLQAKKTFFTGYLLICLILDLFLVTLGLSDTLLNLDLAKQYTFSRGPF